MVACRRVTRGKRPQRDCGRNLRRKNAARALWSLPLPPCTRPSSSLIVAESWGWLRRRYEKFMIAVTRTIAAMIPQVMNLNCKNN